MTFSNADKHREAKRELGLRRRVYPSFVERGSITPKEAARQIAVMEAITDDYARLAGQDEAEERLL